MLSLELLVNTIGVILSLTAFFLLTIKKVKAETLFYNGFNMIGSGLTCWGSWLIGAIPFFVLEGVWSLVALYGIWQIVKNRRLIAQ